MDDTKECAAKSVMNKSQIRIKKTKNLLTFVPGFDIITFALPNKALIQKKNLKKFFIKVKKLLTNAETCDILRKLLRKTTTPRTLIIEQ